MKQVIDALCAAYSEVSAARLNPFAVKALQDLKDAVLAETEKKVSLWKKHGVTGDVVFTVVAMAPGEPSVPYIKRWMSAGLEPEIRELILAAGGQPKSKLRIGTRSGSGGRNVRLNFSMNVFLP